MPIRTQTKTRRTDRRAGPSQTYRKVRADHATETAQDYVEAVADIVRSKGECRVKDLSELLGVSHVTVSRAVARFQQQRLITTEPYRPIQLTAKGERLAAESRLGCNQSLLLKPGDGPIRTQTKTRRTDRRAGPSQTYRKVRADHATETAQDYVEAVADIVRSKGECRVKDLSELLGVSHVTVSRAVARFQQQRLITTEPYRPIQLTAKGERLAAESRRRHEIVLAFLEALGVPKRDSLRDSEGIEHHVGQVTLRCMERFIR